MNLNKHRYWKELLKASCARWIFERELWSMLHFKSLWPHAGLSVCFILHYVEIPVYKSCWQISFDINQIKSYKRFIVSVPNTEMATGDSLVTRHFHSAVTMTMTSKKTWVFNLRNASEINCTPILLITPSLCMDLHTVLNTPREAEASRRHLNL